MSNDTQVAALVAALKAIIECDDEAKSAYGHPGANLNGYGLVDLFDCVGHHFGAGPHKQQPYRSNSLDAALQDARVAVEASARQLSEQPGFVMVPVEFVRGFHALAHNYSLRAEPPDHYRGTEGDAFSNAYRRCGSDLAELKGLLTASPTDPSTEASEPVGEREDDDPWLSGDDMMGASS